jgi:glycosyltransferase involved in cell wall biosynthesis
MSKSRVHATPEVSIVVPIYNEADCIAPFLKELVAVLIDCAGEYEIVCVDDGSTDGSARLLHQARASNKRIRIIHLSRNFGKEAALTAGLKYARGAAVIPMDADLQDPPRLIPFMLTRWREGIHVVNARRAKRLSDSWIKRTSARIFYKAFNGMSEVPIPEDTGDFRLLDRAVVDALNQLPERTRFMKGLFSWVGFRSTEITYERPSRVMGTSKWGGWGLTRLAVDGLTAFSNVPLRLLTVVGAGLSLIAFVVAVGLVLAAAFFSGSIGLESLLLSGVLLFGGIQLLGMGLLGEYLGRLYTESKQRPLFIIQRTEGFEEPEIS